MKANYFTIGVVFIICLIAFCLDIGIHPLRKNYTSDKAKVKYDRNKAKYDKKFKKQQLNNILEGIIKKSNDKSDVRPYIIVYNILPQNISELCALGYEVKKVNKLYESEYIISWENGGVDP